MIKSLVSVEAGQFDAQELGCVDVPVAALTSDPHWFSSPTAMDAVTQLLTLYQSSAVSEYFIYV